MIRVAQFIRKPSKAFFSIERIAEDVRGQLSTDIDVRVVYSVFDSSGLVKRCLNLLQALYCKRDVNHVVGDVHYLGCILPKKNLIITIHDCGMMDRLFGFRRLVYWFFWLWLPVRRAAFVTVVSEKVRLELMRYVTFDQKKLRLIPNAVSPEFIYTNKKDLSHPVRLFQVGVGKNKNLERVIKAVAGRPCKLVILGALNNSQIELLRRSGVDYEAYVDLTRREVVHQYQVADVVIFVSLYEGFGLPIIEANAVGTPVITSDRSPMKEIAGNAAHLVQPEDLVSIAEGIDKVIGDPAYRDRLIENGLRNAVRFSITEISKRYEALYREAV